MVESARSSGVFSRGFTSAVRPLGRFFRCPFELLEQQAGPQHSHLCAEHFRPRLVILFEHALSSNTAVSSSAMRPSLHLSTLDLARKHSAHAC
jgi:hypothetical protein